MTRLLQGHRKANPERGASLVETMIAAAVGLIITAAAVDVFVLHHSQFLAQRARSESQQDIRGGINLMGAELRLASPITSMQAEELVFLANVNDVQGTVLVPIAQDQTSAQVTPSNGWVRGKTVRFCSLSACEDHRLAHDATSGLLVLWDAVRHDCPAGSQVAVINEVRYYLSRTSSVNQKLMREVDHGANPLIEHVEKLSLSYFKDDGQLADRSEDIRLIRLDLRTSSIDGHRGRIFRTHRQDMGVRAL